jgi:PAS domain S-box-containing protein
MVANYSMQASPLGRRHIQGAIALHRQGRIDRMNPAAERLLGWRRHELAGRPLIALTGVDSGQALAHARALLQAQREGHPLRLMETRLRRRDGSMTPVTCTATPRRDGSGKLVLAFSPIGREEPAPEAELRRAS